MKIGIKSCPQITTKASQLYIAPSSSNTTSLEAMTLHWQSWHISGEIQAWKEKVPFPMPSKIAALDLWDTTVYLESLCWLQQCCSKFTQQVPSPGMLYWVSAARCLLESHGLVCPGIPERALSQSVIVWLQGELRELFSSSCLSQMSDREEPWIWMQFYSTPHPKCRCWIKETHEF